MEMVGLRIDSEANALKSSGIAQKTGAVPVERDENDDIELEALTDLCYERNRVSIQISLNTAVRYFS